MSRIVGCTVVMSYCRQFGCGRELGLTTDRVIESRSTAGVPLRAGEPLADTEGLHRAEFGGVGCGQPDCKHDHGGQDDGRSDEYDWGPGLDANQEAGNEAGEAERLRDAEDYADNCQSLRGARNVPESQAARRRRALDLGG